MVEVKLKKPKMVDEFKSFILKGNVLDLAVGIIIGIAFGSVVNSMVNDVIMPPVGLALGGADFRDAYIVLKDGPGAASPPYTSLANATADGANTWRVGLFINTVINFLIVGFTIFMIVRVANKAKRKQEEAPKDPTDKGCPRCFMKVPLKATRCGHCTSEIG